MKAVYAINTFIECGVDSLGYPITSGLRCPGIYETEEDARKAVETNNGDIHEYTYDYALIQRVEFGLYEVEDIIWYKWDEEKEEYIEIPTPNGYEHYIVGAIG